MRSHIEPMTKIARSLRNHREVFLNYFLATTLLSTGVLEGLNDKANLTMRQPYRFGTYIVFELALYNPIGRPPEPDATHHFS